MNSSERKKIKELKKIFRKKNPSSSDGRNGSAGYVYILHIDEDIYKIGKTGNIDRRLFELRAGNPKIELETARRVTNMDFVEKVLHARFSKKRIDRELFMLTSSDIFSAEEYMNSQQPDGL